MENKMVYGERLEDFTILAEGKYVGFDYKVISHGNYPCAYINVGTFLVDPYRLTCHGGITYEGDVLEVGEKSYPGHWLGWDYNHKGDCNSAPTEAELVFGMWDCGNPDGERYTTEEMVRECHAVIYQVFLQIVERRWQYGE